MEEESEIGRRLEAGVVEGQPPGAADVVKPEDLTLPHPMSNTSSSLPSPASGLLVSIVTPEETVLEATAESVVLPLFDGEIGILRGHAPLIGRLGYGELRLRTGEAVTKLYVDGGFVQVVDNVVSVLTGRALPLDKLDADAARKQLEEGLARKASNPDEQAFRDRLVSQARAQLRLAGK